MLWFGEGKKLVLGIETSCDETCAAVIEVDAGGSLKVLSNVISSQIDIHKLYGGVVPEVASRNHLLAIEEVFCDALKTANIEVRNICHIAATTRPGLVGAVMVGRVFAESLASALEKPFIAVNHLAGHIASVMLSNPELKPPFICLVVSGGHTNLYRIEKSFRAKLLGATLDDACGEAFDKVAKVLCLSYPGGPVVAKMAGQAKQNGENIKLVRGDINYGKDLNFSYSGLKSAVINFVNRAKMKKEAIDMAELCAAFQKEAIEQLVVKCKKAQGRLLLAICGGVAANGYLRERLKSAYFPKAEFCGDNAAMIAAASALDIKVD